MADRPRVEDYYNVVAADYHRIYEHDLIEIPNRLGCPVWELREPLERLVKADLIHLNV